MKIKKDYQYVVSIFLIFVLCSTTVIVQSYYVGNLSIYSSDVLEKRSKMHQAILKNKPLRDGWENNGANGINIRIFTVYATELINKLTGLDRSKIYIIIDMVSLLLSLLFLIVFLKKWFPIEYCLLAALFIGNLLPMTYAFHFFHPWDRFGLLLWLLFAYCVRENHYFWCLAFAFIAVLNKYDSVVLPGLYFLTHMTITSWKEPLAKTIGLFTVTFLTYKILKMLIPGGFFPRDISEQVIHNFYKLLDLNIAYPPLLGFGIIFLLGCFGFRKADRFSKASFIFAISILSFPLFLLTNFHELRAEMGVLFLMLPSALFGFQALLSELNTKGK